MMFQKNKILASTLALSSLISGVANATTMTQNSSEHYHVGHKMHMHDMSSHGMNMWMFNLMPMYMTMDGLQSGTSSVAAPADDMMVPTKMDMSMLMFMAMYMTRNWDFMVMGSYNIKTMDMTMNMMGKSIASTMRSEGFGDTQLLISYKFLQTQHQSLKLKGGVSVPTGRINYQGVMPMMSTTLYGYNMQMGSGTFDPIIGIIYGYHWHKWFLQSELKTLQRLYKNYRDYALGDVYQLTLGADYNVWSYLSLGSKVQGVLTTKTSGVAEDTNANWGISYNPQNTGGKVINLIAEAKIKGAGILSNQSLLLQFAYPIYQNLNGIQMKQGWQVGVSFNFMFM
ncbi:hypothetical protein [Cysteiniphilum halobium]|uniref:hypothetical protein n=1 Tax=Cysteiniphilum halobium TaxID=2219059 RepID=UPI003F83D3B5